MVFSATHDVHVFLGDVKVKTSNEESSNEKIEYQAVTTIGHEDPAELLERCGRLSVDLAFGRRGSTRVPTRLSLLKGELNFNEASFNQSLFIPNVKSESNVELLLWIVKINFQSSDDPLLFDSRQINDEGYSIPIHPRSCISMAPNIVIGQPDFIRNHPMVSLIGVCRLYPNLISDNIHKRFTALKGKNPADMPNLSILPMNALPTLFNSLSSCFIGNSSGLLSDLIIQHQTNNKINPIGCISCECISVVNQLIPIPPYLIVGTVNGNSTVAIKGVMIKIIKVSDIRLSLLSVAVPEKCEDRNKIDQLYSSFNCPQRLELYWDNEENKDEEGIRSRILKSMKQKRRKWGKKILWSGDQIQYSAIQGENFNGSEGQVKIDLDYGQIVYMMLPPDGSCSLNCSLHFEAKNTEINKRIKVKLVEDIEVTEMGNEIKEIPFVLETDSKQKRTHSRHGILHIQKYSNEEGVWLKPNTFNERKLIVHSTVLVFLIDDCYESDPFNSPSFQFYESPFSCPKYPVQIPENKILTKPLTVPTPKKEEKKTENKKTTETIIRPEETWIVGGNPRGGVANVPNVIRISVGEGKEASGKYLAEGLKIHILATHENQIKHNDEISSILDTKIPIEFNTTINHDGSCDLTFIINRTGHFKLHVSLYGFGISGSPFDVVFVPGYPDSQATRTIKPTEPKKCFASTVQSVDLLRPIQLDQIVGGIKAGIKRLTDATKTIHGLQYDNEIKIQVCDSSGLNLSSGGHLIAAQGKGGAKVTDVIDHQNGVYSIHYMVVVPYATNKELTPELNVTLDGISIYGFPIRLEPQNIEEINGIYEKINELCLMMFGETKIHKLLESGNLYAAANQIDWICSKEKNYIETELKDLEITAGEVPINDNDETIETEDKQTIRGLQERRLELQQLHSKLIKVAKDVEQAHSSQSMIYKLLQRFIADCDKNAAVLKADIANIKKFQDFHMLPLIPFYEETYSKFAAEVTTNLIRVVDTINANNFESLEELLQLHYDLADELRKLYRFDLANKIEDANPLIVEEIDLRWQRFTLEWKEKRLDQLDSILCKKELNLQFVENNFQESLRSVPDSKSDGVDEVWEAPPVTESRGIETEDPYRALGSILGPMIFYRATGKSPSEKIPASEETIKAITRGECSGADFKRFWSPPHSLEVQEIRKILRACPRLKFAMNETFFALSRSTPLSFSHAVSGHQPTSGIPWDSFKHFCSELKLSRRLLADPVALRHLFIKFSFEDRSSFSSTFGFVRRIPFSLWLGFLRELSYLNTLAQCLTTNDLNQIPHLSRLRCFQHFIEAKFCPFYSSFSASFSQFTYYPLFKEFNVRDQKSVQDPLYTNVRTKEELREILLLKLSHLLDYDALEKEFNKRSIEKSIDGDQRVKIMRRRNCLQYVMETGLCPSYISTENCVAIYENVLAVQHQAKSQLTFEKFVVVFCEVLLAVLDVDAVEAKNLQSAAHLLSLQLTELLSLINLPGHADA